MRFIVHELKKLKKDSKIIKYAGYYVEYCLWYLQKCIEWLNRNAYIMTAIDGTSFCTSAWKRLGAPRQKHHERRHRQHRR